MLNRVVQREGSRAVAVLVSCVLGFGGAFGEIGELLRDSVHVCTCSMDDHDCDCPHCAGPHVLAPDETAVKGLAYEQVPCGEETGARSELVFTRGLLMRAPPASPEPMVVTLTTRFPPVAPGHSRLLRGPEPPPPRV